MYYLSNYGRRDPNLACGAVPSLKFLETIPYLDQNADHLADNCIALRFAGQRTQPQLGGLDCKTLYDFQVI